MPRFGKGEGQGGRVTGNFAKCSQEKAFVLQDVFYCLFLMSTMGGGGGGGGGCKYQQMFFLNR